MWGCAQIRSLLAGLVVLAMMASTAGAAVLVEVGNWDVPEGSTAFNIPITITTDAADTVTDLVLLVQVADGGPEIGGSTAGPQIVGLTLAGSIWEATDLGINGFSSGLGVGDFPQIVQYEVSIDVNTGQPVTATGILATVTIDASGFTAGQSFDLRIEDTAGGDSNLLGADTIGFVNGSITIVPEPASALLLGLGGAALLLRRRVMRS